MRGVTILFLATAPAYAASPPPPDFNGTVDASAPALIDRARHDAESDGYRPTAVEFVQDGNVFLTATRGNQIYEVTLTQSGKIFVSNGAPELVSESSWLTHLKASAKNFETPVVGRG